MKSGCSKKIKCENYAMKIYESSYCDNQEENGKHNWQYIHTILIFNQKGNCKENNPKDYENENKQDLNLSLL